MQIDRKINLVGQKDPGLAARKVWGVLFPAYRELNPHIEYLDSFLCDYDRLKEYFSTGKSFFLSWHTDIFGNTTMTENRINEDWYVVIEYNAEQDRVSIRSFRDQSEMYS